jgi:hypothetical protein
MIALRRQRCLAQGRVDDWQIRSTSMFSATAKINYGLLNADDACREPCGRNGSEKNAKRRGIAASPSSRDVSEHRTIL